MLIDEFYSSFNLPAGTAIYINAQGIKSIIDPWLTTEEFIKQMITCKIREILDHNSEHMLIETVLNVSVRAIPQREKYSWERLSHVKFERMLKQRLPSPPVEATTP